jgi:hypothetical protein
MATNEPVYRTIDGANYICRKLPSMKALQLTTELARHLGKPLVTVLAGASSEDADLWTIVQYVLHEGLDGLYPDATKGLMLRVMESVQLNHKADSHLGDEARFNEHFDARPGGALTALEVWLWALEVNFRGFFNAARGRLTPAAPAAAGNGSAGVETPSA